METQNTRTRKVMRKACLQEGIAVVAASIGFHPGTLTNQISGSGPYEPLGKTPNIIDAAINLMHACKNDEILRYMAQHFGFILVRNPSIKGKLAREPFTKLTREYLHLLEEMNESLSDGKITGAEAANLRHYWEIVKATGEEFVLAAERGSYCQAKA